MKTKFLLFIASLFLLLLPSVNYAQYANPAAPVVGTTANFVLFTGAGNISGAGLTSTFVGKVGTNAGTIGSLTSALLSPTFEIANTITVQAKADAIALLADLNGRTQNAIAPAELGGSTLYKGVYAQPGAMNISGTLTLNGGASDIFIIRCGGAFTTGAGATIVLTGGAQAKNVFFAIHGACAMAANTNLKGIFICDAAVSVGANEILEGNAYTTAGAITTLDGMKLTSAGGGGIAVPDFGNLDQYVLYTAAGAINYLGSPALPIPGKVATYAGFITGFVDTVPSSRYYADGGATRSGEVAYVTAMTNKLLAIKAELKAYPDEIIANAAYDFTTNVTLTPGSYQVNGATTTDCTITLDGENQTNPVFVIEIVGALSFHSKTKIVLINGATAARVFWVVDGAVEYLANSEVRGTVISGGAILIWQNVLIEGRVETSAGAINLYQGVRISLASTTVIPVIANVLTDSQTILQGASPADLVLSNNSSAVAQWESSPNSNFSGGTVTTIANTATILNTDCLGAPAVTTYYRVKLTDGSYSNPVTITVTPTPGPSAGYSGPDLGALADFQLFTKSGAITLTPDSTLSGKMMTKTGTASITGFAAPTYTSYVVPPTDSSVAPAEIALDNIISSIISKTAISHAAAFTIGETVTPGTYELTAAGTIPAGDLYLNGTASDIFIFKMPGALTITAGAKMHLTGGITASNIFWLTGIDGAASAVTVGAGSDVYGTFISNSPTAGALTFGANVNFIGRLYTKIGAIVYGATCLTSMSAASVPSAPSAAKIVASGNQTISSGTSPTAITVPVGTTVVRWESALKWDFTGTVTSIASTSVSYTPSALSTKTYFRAVTSIDPTYSTTVTIGITQITIAGTISPEQNLATAGIPEYISITGNNGSVIKWEKSINADMSGATVISTNPSILTSAVIGSLSVKTYFRATVQNCVSLTEVTNIISVSVGLVLTADQTIPSGGIPADLVLLGNKNAVEYWESSTDPLFPAGKTNIAHTSNVLSGSCIGSLFTTTYFRARANGLYSNSITITVDAPLVAASLVAMGTLDEFVVFTSLGGINGVHLATSDNVFTGLVGTNLGAIVNMSSIVGDPRLQIQNLKTIQAKADLITLKATLTGYSINGTPHKTHAAAFGLGEVVEPGVYDLTAAVTVTGKLVFDGKGDPNSIFIFNIPAAFSTAASAEMKLINGAQSGNIFWNIGAASESGASSHLIGTFVSSIGGINLGANNIVDGRLFTQVGGIQLPYSTLNLATNTPTVKVNTIVVSASQTIASGATPAALTLSGNTTAIVRWEKAIDFAFTIPKPIANTTTTLTAPEIGALTVPTYFRAVVKNGFSTAYSTVITISMIKTTVHGTISNSQTIVSGLTPATLTITGNNGPIVLWQKSTDLAFTTPINISNSTTVLTGNSIGALTAITYFRAQVQNCTCAPEFTNTVTITPVAITVPGVLTANQTVTDAHLTLSTYSGTIVEWESCDSADFSTTVTTIANLLPTYNTTALGTSNGLKYFRVKIRAADNSISYSNVAPIIITGIVVPFVTSTSLANDQASHPTALTADLTLSPYTGTIVRWESSENSDFSGTITSINTTDPNYTAPTVGSTTKTVYYRVVLQNPNSLVVYSNTSSISVRAITTPTVGTLASTQVPNTITADLNLTGSSGTILGWESSLDPSFEAATTTVIPLNQTNNSGYNIINTSTISDDGPAVLKYYRVVFQNPGSAIVYSNLANINIFVLDGGIVNASQTFCSPGTPAALALVGSTGTILRWESSTDGFSSNIVTIINTSSAFPFTGTLNTTTSYRAVVQGNVKTKNATAAVITIAGTTTYSYNSATGVSSWSNGLPTFGNSAILNTNFVSGGTDIETCNLTVGAGKTVVITAGDNVTLKGFLAVAASGSFTLENNSTLLQPSGAANTGNVIIKRDSAPMYRYDYTLWSSPVLNQNLRNYSIETLVNRFYIYNSLETYGANGNYAPIFVADPDTNHVVHVTLKNYETYNFEPGMGYYVRSPNNFIDYSSPSIAAQTFHGVFKGTINNGDYSVSLEPALNGYNLLGNPYPSELDLKLFFNENRNAIDGTVWLWRKISNSTANAYTTMNLMGAISAQGLSNNDVNTYKSAIKTGQGFFVRLQTPLSANTLVFNNSMRVGNSKTKPTFFYKNAAVTEMNRVWLNLSDLSGTVTQTLVGYTTDATNAIDYGIDGKSLGDTAINLTSLVGSSEFAIQGRALPFDSTDEVPLNFKTNVAGTYAIALDHFDGLFAGTQGVYLKDNLTAKTIDLKAGTYSFSSDAGNFASRFVLVYQNKTLGVSNPVFEESSILAYKKANSLRIESGSFVMSSIELYDLNGRLLFKKEKVNSSSFAIENLVFSNQMVIAKIKTVDNAIVSKKILF